MPSDSSRIVPLRALRLLRSVRTGLSVQLTCRRPWDCLGRRVSARFLSACSGTPPVAR